MSDPEKKDDKKDDKIEVKATMTRNFSGVGKVKKGEKFEVAEADAKAFVNLGFADYTNKKDMPDDLTKAIERKKASEKKKAEKDEE
ncbi:MAG: hypothetical protein JRJ54_07190 [Deltaproteobacteria bacterium]|nr:hypothetical protein [Deltaproteobacteria bacterium]